MRKIFVGLLLIGLGTLPVAYAGKPAGAGNRGNGGSGGGTEGVVGQNLGVLPGDKYSDAWGVNAQGHAVGRSYNTGRPKEPRLIKAFYWAEGMHRLFPATVAPVSEPPRGSEASAISGGQHEVVVGMEERTICSPDPMDPTQQVCVHPQYPVLWEDPGANPVAVLLDESRGRAFGINDSGSLAVGSCNGGAGAIWSLSEPGRHRENILISSFPAADRAASFPDGHDISNHEISIRGVALDVNNEGIVAGQLTWTDETALKECLATNTRPCAVDVSYSKAYFYDSSSGAGRVLPTPTGYGDADAFAVSNVSSAAGNVFYVAGSARVKVNDPWGTGLRWTVKVETGEIWTDLLSQQAWAQGVNDQGFIAGTHNSAPSRRGNIIQTATLWSESVGYIPLKPPGGSDSASRAMAGRCLGSSGAIYVVGEANVSGAWTAARWEIQCSTANPSP